MKHEFALFHRPVSWSASSEPWTDSGLRAATIVSLYEQWQALPASTTNLQETVARLVPAAVSTEKTKISESPDLVLDARIAERTQKKPITNPDPNNVKENDLVVLADGTRCYVVNKRQRRQTRGWALPDISFPHSFDEMWDADDSWVDESALFLCCESELDGPPPDISALVMVAIEAKKHAVKASAEFQRLAVARRAAAIAQDDACGALGKALDALDRRISELAQETT